VFDEDSLSLTVFPFFRAPVIDEKICLPHKNNYRKIKLR